ncbi:hypothetical protein KC19_VG241700 [Ceratodon purpureus]|uniref:Uncharacterized protein n=1 Tax=Ceratodon purpureus TaxID=3225 RepID=A0A8T0HTX6_CERPU|nr:hypothetical protein KC19_VG241700 [Ceratodon purpureus]
MPNLGLRCRWVCPVAFSFPRASQLSRDRPSEQGMYRVATIRNHHSTTIKEGIDPIERNLATGWRYASSLSERAPSD